MSDVRNRLLSIQHDVEDFVKPLLARYPDYPVVANERCGSWYAHAKTKTSSCYFKSTDGHVGTWNFSLKRMNLPIVSIAAKSKVGGCMILDASVRKELPDSLSRTIPIWTCVLNRIVVRYRDDMDLPPLSNWDTTLYTPSWLISEEEHATICNLLDERVESLYTSGVIVNPRKLVETLIKPLRPYWITPNRTELELEDGYHAIICVSCSTLSVNLVKQDLNFEYVPGAADDHESWAHKLTSRLFWEHLDELLEASDCITAIEGIVAKDRHDNSELIDLSKSHDAIGDTGIYIGTRRAGRPPECWETFDAILAVTDLEYDRMKETLPDGTYYLQMPVEEGKRDRTELERWMSVGIAFLAVHHSKRILVHCAQGRDRSVAVAMACIALLCELKDPLEFRPEVGRLTQDSLYGFAFGEGMKDGEELYANSGLSNRLVQALLGRPGRDCLLNWLRQELQLHQDDLASKETLRVTLHLIQQYREKASPSRSIMQKLNRFFMSAQYQ